MLSLVWSATCPVSWFSTPARSLALPTICCADATGFVSMSSKDLFAESTLLKMDASGEAIMCVFKVQCSNEKSNRLL